MSADGRTRSLVRQEPQATAVVSGDLIRDLGTPTLIAVSLVRDIMHLALLPVTGNLMPVIPSHPTPHHPRHTTCRVLAGAPRPATETPASQSMARRSRALSYPNGISNSKAASSSIIERMKWSMTRPGARSNSTTSAPRIAWQTTPIGSSAPNSARCQRYGLRRNPGPEDRQRN